MLKRINFSHALHPRTAKINLAAIALLLFLLPGFSSCKKDKNDDQPSLREAIAGEWEINSFSIGGVEIAGTTILALNMKFEACRGAGGDFEWSIHYGDGSGDSQSGIYEVDEQGRDIELRSNDGETFKMDLDIDGDKIELSGTLYDERVVIQADRD